ASGTCRKRVRSFSRLFATGQTESRVSQTPAASPGKASQALPAIFWGGLTAGGLGSTAPLLPWGATPNILKSVARALLGVQALLGGWGIAALGLGLHFLIAFSAASVYYAASRKLGFLKQRAVLWGFLFGIAVYMFMSWVVVPLSAFPKTHAPFSVTSLVLS